MGALRWTVYSCAFLLALALADDSEDGVPPSISSHLNKDYIFREKITLPCTASGNPKPTFTWYKNGQPIDTTAPNIVLSQDPEDSSLTIDPATIMDSGYYQCRASNAWGTSVSIKARLRKAFLGYFPKKETETNSKEEGLSLVIKCAGGRSVPKSTFSWSLMKDKIDQSPVPLVSSKRIQLDDSGNLYFSHVTVEDSQDGKLYKCNTFNSHLDITTGGSYTAIEVTPNADAEDVSPEIAYSTPGLVTVTTGGNLKLKCIFSGRPEPQVTWSKRDVDGTSDRWQMRQFDTELWVTSVQEEDAGVYTCTGSNGVDPSADIVIQVIVESVPQFTESISNTDVAKGSDQSFVCRADADPKPDTQWFINGDPIISGGRREILPDGSVLKISDVCRECPGGATDVMVVQCNVSNPHGYAFADAYLNVVDVLAERGRPCNSKNIISDVKYLTVQMSNECFADASGRLQGAPVLVMLLTFWAYMVL